ncbi:BclA C-terminal domain-containing protein [Clostridium sp. Marseille-Q7071]
MALHKATGSCGSGATGPNDLTGAGITSYGYFYSPGTALGLEVFLGGASLTLTNNGVVVGLTHTPGNAQVTVNNASDYEVEFIVATTIGVNAAFAIAVNGTIQTNINYSVLVATGEVSGQGILTLAAGDQITIVNNSLIPVTLSLASTVSISLTVKQLR